MEILRGMYELAAQALAAHPEMEGDIKQQTTLCRQYGIFFDRMTDDELSWLYNLANQYMGE